MRLQHWTALRVQYRPAALPVGSKSLAASMLANYDEAVIHSRLAAEREREDMIELDGAGRLLCAACCITVCCKPHQHGSYMCGDGRGLGERWDLSVSHLLHLEGGFLL